jgi:uncharacterized protein with von Willebrand factor type A (vWA) domain
MPWDDDLSWLGKIEGSNTNTVAQDRLDGTMYRELRDASPELRRLAESDGDTFPALLQDVWAGFYKSNPELQAAGKVDPAYRVNRPLTERFLDDPTTAQARAVTMLDDLSSAIATLGTGRKLQEEIENRPELKEAMNQASRAAQYASGEVTAKGGNGQAKAQEYAAKAQALMDKNARDIRRAVREAVQAGQKEAEDGQRALAGWGMEPGELSTIPLGDRLELVKKLSTPAMKRAGDIVGRFKNLARARQKQKIKHERDEIHSMTQGNDLERVLPTELAALGHPVRKLDFYKKYSERSLSQYDLQAHKPQGRGPIVALVDRSGSMSGGAMDWATATVLALLDTAIRQHRKMAIAFFDTDIRATFEFAGKGRPDIDQLSQIATISSGGGTRYWPPLVWAISKIGEIDYKKADVVMITDGECQLSDTERSTLLDMKKQYECRIWSILIGMDDPYGELAQWSDRVWELRQLCDEAAGDLFEEVY